MGPPHSTESELHVRFEQLTAAEASIAARELQKELRRSTGGEVRTEIRRSRAEAQDLGDIVVIILGTPAAIAFAARVAEGIEAFIARWKSKVVIETDQGRIVFSGHAMDHADLEAIVKAMCPPKSVE